MFNTIRTIASATLISAVAATSALAGSLTPGTTENHHVDAGGTVSYVEEFHGGALAQVEITGDGASDIDLYIYDKAGMLVARSISYGHVEYVEFTPAATDEFEIRIENFGTSNSSNFDIWTN